MRASPDFTCSSGPIHVDVGANLVEGLAISRGTIESEFDRCLGRGVSATDYGTRVSRAGNRQFLARFGQQLGHITPARSSVPTPRSHPSPSNSLIEGALRRKLSLPRAARRGYARSVRWPKRLRRPKGCRTCAPGSQIGPALRDPPMTGRLAIPSQSHRPMQLRPRVSTAIASEHPRRRTIAQEEDRPGFSFGSQPAACANGAGY